MERKLIKKVRKGNKSSANKLVSMYYKEIYVYVYKQTLNKELCMDLTQEIFISMLQSLNNYNEEKASFRTWLYKIATYKIVDYYRSKYYKHSKISVSIEEIKLFYKDDITNLIEYKDKTEKILEIIKTFDSSLQQIFRLKVFKEYTFKEISKILKIPESTVKTKYYSIIKKIKSMYKE